MKKTLNYRYMLKRALPMMAFIGAGLMVACEKEPKATPTAEPEPIDPVKVLSFGRKIGLDSLNYDNVMRYANDPRIEQIIYFLDSTNNNNNFAGFSTQGRSLLRGALQKCLDYTPKATGAGTFIFFSREVSVEDSLWFVQHGWKIRPD